MGNAARPGYARIDPLPRPRRVREEPVVEVGDLIPRWHMIGEPVAHYGYVVEDNDQEGRQTSKYDDYADEGELEPIAHGPRPSLGLVCHNRGGLAGMPTDV